MIWELLPEPIRSVYPKHKIAAIQVQGNALIRIRLLWDRTWDTWRFYNGSWHFMDDRKGA